MAAPARALPAALRKPWLWAAAAGVVVLILLAALLLPRGDSPAADSPEPGASAQTEPSSAPQSLEEADRDEVFAGAVTVSSPEELTAALTDESVPAVICDGWIGLGGEIEALSKPLLVPEGTDLALTGGLRLGDADEVHRGGHVAHLDGEQAHDGDGRQRGGDRGDRAGWLRHSVLLRRAFDLAFTRPVYGCWCADGWPLPK